jgi:hypothetical protein
LERNRIQETVLGLWLKSSSQAPMFIFRFTETDAKVLTFPAEFSANVDKHPERKLQQATPAADRRRVMHITQ